MGKHDCNKSLLFYNYYTHIKVVRVRACVIYYVVIAFIEWIFIASWNVNKSNASLALVLHREGVIFFMILKSISVLSPPFIYYDDGKDNGNWMILVICQFLRIIPSNHSLYRINFMADKSKYTMEIDPHNDCAVCHRNKFTLTRTSMLTLPPSFIA